MVKNRPFLRVFRPFLTELIFLVNIYGSVFNHVKNTRHLAYSYFILFLAIYLAICIYVCGNDTTIKIPIFLLYVNHVLLYDCC